MTTSIQTRTAIVLAAATELIIGMGFYLFPDGFLPTAYRSLAPAFPFLAVALIASGLTLIVDMRYGFPSWLRRQISIPAALPLFAVAGATMAGGGVTGAAGFAGMAAAVLIAPWLSNGARPRRTGRELLLLIMGLIEAALAAAMIARPSLFSAPSHALLRPWLTLIGLVSLPGAVALLALFFRPPARKVTAACLRAAGAVQPLILMAYFAMIGTIGGLVWGAAVVSIVAGPALRLIRRLSQRKKGGRGSRDRLFPHAERNLELLNWATVLVVVAISTAPGARTPFAGNAPQWFVALISVYTICSFWVLPKVGPVSVRVECHLAVLTLGLGILLSDPAQAAGAFLPILGALPLIAGLLKGWPGGIRSILLALVAVAGAEVVLHLQTGAPAPAELDHWVHEAVLLIGTAVGTRLTVAQRRVNQMLCETQRKADMHVRQLSLIDRINRAVRSSLELAEILQTTVQELGTAMQVDRCYIMPRGQHPDLPQPAFEYVRDGVPSIVGSGFKAPIAAIAGARGQVIAVRDLTAPDLEPEFAEVRSSILGFGIRSVLAVPVQAGAELKAVLAIHVCTGPKDWTAGEIEFVSAIASQVAVAITHAEHHDSVERSHRQLLEAHEDLQAKDEELAAQQEELFAQHEELLTQQSQLEAALRSAKEAEEAKERLVAILEASTDMVAQYDLKEGWQYFNPSARATLAIGSDADVPRHSIRTFYSRAVRGEQYRAIRNSALTSGLWMGETMLVGRDGREVPVSQLVIAHRGPDGAVAYLSTVSRDISAAKRAEESLRESEKRFRTAFRHAPIGMALVGMDHSVHQVNRSLCQMLGYTEPQLLALKVPAVIDPTDPIGARKDIWAGKVDAFQKEQRLIHRSGSIVWALLNVSVIRDALGLPLHLICQLLDITERKSAEEKLKYLADYDSLTNLLNRRRFQHELARVLAESRAGGRYGALLFMDFDQFKYVNDSLGHAAGDELLRAVSALLTNLLKGSAIIARLGGDEFAIILPDAGREEAEQTAQEVVRTVRDSVHCIAGHPVGITVSVGVVLFPDHGSSAQELLAQADQAMYQVKESGRNHYRVYAPEAGRIGEMSTRLNWEQRIRKALEHDRFILHFQPMLDLRYGRTAQYEVLLRMVDKDGSLIRPRAFLDVAESYGLIHSIDRCVVRHAIQTIARHRESHPALALAVNLSGKAFSDPDLLPLIRAELSEHKVKPGQLVLEITETAAIRDFDRARQFIMALREMGCRFSLDDFGVGFASFNYLKHLPVDYVKIDGSFIEHLSENEGDQQLVRAIVAAAHALGKETIAESVSDQESIEMLKQFGVTYVQGNYLAEASPTLDEVDLAPYWP